MAIIISFIFMEKLTESLIRILVTLFTLLIKRTNLSMQRMNIGVGGRRRIGYVVESIEITSNSGCPKMSQQIAHCGLFYLYGRKLKIVHSRQYPSARATIVC